MGAVIMIRKGAVRVEKAVEERGMIPTVMMRMR
jgi:hypothetical protein